MGRSESNIPLSYKIIIGDSGHMKELPDESVHLVVTSPPYPMIKMWDALFDSADPQIGRHLSSDRVSDIRKAYFLMHAQLEKSFRECARNNICEFEVDGIEWAITSNNLGEIQTDRHYSAVARNLFDIPEDSTIMRRFMGALDFESNTLMIASERWVTKGTNDHPFGWIQIEMNELQSILDQSNVLYVGGPQKYEIIIFISPT